jgi:PAS domain S-box-containing protein
MVFLVLATTVALSLFTYHFVTESLIPRALDRLETKAALGATELEGALSTARQDLLVIQNAVGVQQLVATRSGGPIVAQADAQLRADIAERFVAALRGKPALDQLRIIGAADGGRELLRVDRGGPNGTERIVPDSELTPQGEREYVKRTMSLARADVYASQILRDRSGDPTAPLLLHIGMPLRAPDGGTFGVILIDYDLGPLFEHISSRIAGSNLVKVVNAAGDYLFDFGPGRRPVSGDKAPARIQDDFPEFDTALGGGNAGSAIWRDRNGARYGVGWQTVRVVGGSGITILVAGPYGALNHGLSAVSRSALAGGALAILLALLLAVGFARSLSKPLTQMTEAVQGLARGEQVVMPTKGGREIAILAASFAEMATQLGRKQKLLENTVESIRDSVIVADENGTVVVTNAAARRQLRVAPGFNSMTAPRKFACFLADAVTPLPLSSSPLARALRGENVDDLEIVVQPEQPAAKVHVVANARPLRDELGNLRGAVTVLRDITEQRQAHQALVDSEQMAQAIISTALDAFVQTDMNGVVLDWSPQAEALTGWSRAEAVGAQIGDLVFPEALRLLHRQRVMGFLDEVARGGGGGGLRYETRIKHKDGHEGLVEVSLAALRRGDGYIINAFVRDITQKRFAEEQLIQAQKMESVGQLTGGIAHDFNNMLTVITGTIEILADAVKQQPNLSTIARMISDAADRASQLTANLLAFARKQPLQPVEIDVNGLIEEVVKLLAPALGRHINIETKLSEHAWPALVDPAQLSSALVNLAINARDAMPSGGTLTFATTNSSLSGHEAEASGVEAGDYVVIEVIDNGTGIPEAIRDRIFDPFFSTKKVGTGSGLGLSMVFGFAKQSGGTIEVRSEVGRGATFRIVLPRANSEPLQIFRPADAEMRGGSETILCVEDDNEVRSYVTGQLASLGYKVISAVDAAEALAIVEAGTQFDLLFTDIVMPGNMNGRQLADKIAELRPGLRVLFTSGNAYGVIPSQGHAGLNVQLLSKPYRRAELARMLRRCLDQPSDAAGDAVSLPYSVVQDLNRLMRDNPPEHLPDQDQGIDRDNQKTGTRDGK